jgi:hypothetical protein
MLRVAIVVVAVLATYDHVKYDGKFASGAAQASKSILRHFR